MNFITCFGFISSPQVTSEQLVMLLELLLEEEELSEEAMDTLQRAYNLRGRDAEVRPHKHSRRHRDRRAFTFQLRNPLQVSPLSPRCTARPLSSSQPLPLAKPQRYSPSCVRDSALLNGTTEGFCEYMRACFPVFWLQLCMLAAEGFFTVQRIFIGVKTHLQHNNRPC